MEATHRTKMEVTHRTKMEVTHRTKMEVIHREKMKIVLKAQIKATMEIKLSSDQKASLQKIKNLRSKQKTWMLMKVRRRLAIIRLMTVLAVMMARTKLVVKALILVSKI